MPCIIVKKINNEIIGDTSQIIWEKITNENFPIDNKNISWYSFNINNNNYNKNNDIWKTITNNELSKISINNKSNNVNCKIKHCTY